MEIIFNAISGGAVMTGIVVIIIVSINQLSHSSFKKKRKIVKTRCQKRGI